MTARPRDFSAFASDMSRAKAEPINGVLGVVTGKNISNLPDAVLANVLIRMGQEATSNGMGNFYSPQSPAPQAAGPQAATPVAAAPAASGVRVADVNQMQAPSPFSRV